MTNKSKDNVHRELELIRKLMDEDNLSDYQIIEQLQINRRTFYRYKKKLRVIYEKEWAKNNTANTLYSYGKFYDSLEYGYREAKKIVDNPNSKPLERIEAIKTMCSAKQQIAQLDRKGPIFQPQLPNKVLEIASKEITV